MIKALLATAAVLTLGAIGLAPAGLEDSPAAGVRLTFVDLQWIGNHKLSDRLGDLTATTSRPCPTARKSSAVRGTRSASGSSVFEANNLRWRFAKCPTARARMPRLGRAQGSMTGCRDPRPATFTLEPSTRASQFASIAAGVSDRIRHDGRPTKWRRHRRRRCAASRSAGGSTPSTSSTRPCSATPSVPTTARDRHLYRSLRGPDRGTNSDHLRQGRARLVAQL